MLCRRISYDIAELRIHAIVGMNVERQPGLFDFAIFLVQPSILELQHDRLDRRSQEDDQARAAGYPHLNDC